MGEAPVDGHVQQPTLSLRDCQTGRAAAFACDSRTLSVAAIGGQRCSYSWVKVIGAMVFAATINARQAVSIRISFTKYGLAITPTQIPDLL